MGTAAEGATDNLITNIYTTLGEDHDDDNMQDVKICIFKVPKSLSASKPEVYVPKLVGLGPYHHLRPELQHMQTYKLSEVKNICKGFGGISLKKLIEVLNELFIPPIRACYETYLDMNNESLASIIAIDGLFLFQLLCCCYIGRGNLVKLEFMRKLVESTGTRLARDTTLRDAMLLENQIPILALKVILIIEISSGMPGQPNLKDVVSDLFPLTMLGFCEGVSPLSVLRDYPLYKALRHSHLLDLLYHLVTLNVSPEKNSEEEQKEAKFLQEMYKKVEKEIRPQKLKPSASPPIELLPLQLKKPVKLIERLLQLPWSRFWANLCSAVNAAPFVEEILIPKATELHKAGIKFCSADHITLIKFHSDTRSFHLPIIKIDINSEVVLRNLVAYEAKIKLKTESLILTRYMELMSGLIKSSEDVKVLKEVVQSESMKDDDVAKFFSETSKSIRATNTSDLDKEIDAVNDFYNPLWKVSARKFIRKWRWVLWSYCKVLAGFLVLLLMAIQAFCSVYECRRLSFNGSPSLAQLFAGFLYVLCVCFWRWS